MRIIIADTRPGVRSALELLLKRQPEFEVVDKVASTVALLAAVRAHQPQMVLLDWELARREQAGLIDLMRASSASRWHIFWQVKLPTSGSHVFAGLEVAVAFALIGCVVMEFVGSTRGMGFIIQDSSNTFDLPLTFAAVITLGIVGVLGNSAVRILRHVVLFWEPRDRPAGGRHNA